MVVRDRGPLVAGDLPLFVLGVLGVVPTHEGADRVHLARSVAVAPLPAAGRQFCWTSSFSTNCFSGTTYGLKKRQ